MTAVDFDEATHTYAVAGRVLPSVTQILKAVGIIDDSYYAPGSDERGTAIHLACQLDDEGDLDESTLDPAIRPYLNAWREFRATLDNHDLMRIEQRLADPVLGFAGTIDRIVPFNAIRAEIIDIKSGAPEPWHAIQLAAYQLLAKTTGKRTAVYLSADGTYKLRNFGCGEDRNVFLAALAIWNWRNKK
jgi:hypothetical protein